MAAAVVSLKDFSISAGRSWTKRSLTIERLSSSEISFQGMGSRVTDKAQAPARPRDHDVHLLVRLVHIGGLPSTVVAGVEQQAEEGPELQGLRVVAAPRAVEGLTWRPRPREHVCMGRDGRVVMLAQVARPDEVVKVRKALGQRVPQQTDHDYGAARQRVHDGVLLGRPTKPLQAPSFPNPKVRREVRKGNDGVVALRDVGRVLHELREIGWQSSLANSSVYGFRHGGRSSGPIGRTELPSRSTASPTRPSSAFAVAAAGSPLAGTEASAAATLASVVCAKLSLSPTQPRLVASA
eukprot:scaffold41434_cov63-Phaeocystis_antarctica.AAC.2